MSTLEYCCKSDSLFVFHHPGANARAPRQLVIRLVAVTSPGWESPGRPLARVLLPRAGAAGGFQRRGEHAEPRFARPLRRPRPSSTTYSSTPEDTNSCHRRISRTNTTCGAKISRTTSGTTWPRQASTLRIHTNLAPNLWIWVDLALGLGSGKAWRSGFRFRAGGSPVLGSL